MEFKSLTNIETSFRQIRLYAFVFAIVCVAVSGYAVYASYGFAKEQREKIYVLDQGKSLMLALSQDCLLYTSPSPRDGLLSRMPSSA